MRYLSVLLLTSGVAAAQQPPQAPEPPQSPRLEQRVAALEQRMAAVESRCPCASAPTAVAARQEGVYHGEERWAQLYQQAKRSGWSTFHVGLGPIGSGYVDGYFPAGWKGLENGFWTATSAGSDNPPYLRKEEQREMPRQPVPVASVPAVQYQSAPAQPVYPVPVHTFYQGQPTVFGGGGFRGFGAPRTCGPNGCQ